MSRVQAGTVNASSGVTTQTTTLAGVVAGHLLELSVHWDMNAASGKPTLDSTAVTAGWLEAGTAGPQVAAGNSGWITGVTKFYLQNCPSGSNSCKINFANSARCNSQMVEYSGYATSGALDKVATNVTASATTLTATTAATSQANELVTASIAARFVAGNANISLTDPPTGYTSNAVLQDTNTYAAFESSYKEVTSTGTQAATWSWAGAGEATALVVTYGTSAGTPATLSAPTPSGTIGTSTTASPGATTNQGSGTGYVVVTTASLAGITAAQIKAGQNASGSTSGVTSGNVAISATGAFTISLTGLTQTTAYNYAVVQNNANGDSNIVTGSFTTAATPPTITTPASGASVAYLGTMTLTGTNFGASQGAGAILLGTVAQTASGWSNTGATVASVARGTLPYGAVNLTASNNAGGTSAPTSVNLTPQAGWAYVTLATPFATTGDRITAIADLASGDQLAYDTKSGAITVNSDATWVDSTGTVSSFNVEAWTSGSGWGSTATQTLSGTPLAANASASASGQGTLTRGGALMGGGASMSAIGAGTLTTFSALSGSGAVVARGVGTLSLGSAGASLAGGGSVSAVGSATLTIVASGASLAGAGAVSARGSATLTVGSAGVSLGGAASASASGQGTLSTYAALGGASGAKASGQGTLTTYAALGGSASVRASGSAALTVLNPGATLAASAPASPFGTATLTIGPPVSIYSTSVRSVTFPADTYPAQPPVVSIVPRLIPAYRPQYSHDPSAVLDYCWILTALVEPNDSIESAEFILCQDAPGGAPISGATLTLGQILNGSGPQQNAVWGWLAIQDQTLAGKTLACTCRFTTANGRTDERTFWALLRYR